jgi:transglutaminase-like putative cysteine protease
MIFFKNKTTKLDKNNRMKSPYILTTKNAWFLWLCQCLNIAIIALELSPWMLAIIALSLAWQALLLHNSRDNIETISNKSANKVRDNKKPRIISPIILATFALMGCVVIAITAKQVGLLLSMVHLLCFSYVLKAFELKARSDFYQLLLLGLFILASSLIFRQDLSFSMITVALLVINLAVLLQFFSAHKSFTTNIKVIVILLAQSTILAIVLFLVFPRLSPFWQVPQAKSAEIGLSDTVKPGDIANLTRSTKLAFRADFGQQKIPDYSQLYWRAMVLEDYDGRQWSRKKTVGTRQYKGVRSIEKSVEKSILTDASKTGILPLNYQVTVKPSFQKYLFSLAPAVAVGKKNGIVTQADYTFTNAKIITQAKSYQLTSYLTAPLAVELSLKSKQINLSYPVGSNPRLEQLALQLQHNYVDVKARAQAILSLINKGQYAYTLQPPLLKNNSLDQFFFDTQAGFCVHYASAFTFLMRASGVPARMVTGYLGGEFNGFVDAQKSITTGHLSIYQYDAHAWAEIWVAGKGWIRIDPTSAVDPQRVNSGWSSDLLQEQSALNNELLSLYQMKNNAWLSAIRLQFDALDYQWTRWVIGFSTKQQLNLFNNWFGKMVSWKLALIMAISLVVSMVTLMLFLHLLNRSKRTQFPLAKWQVIYHKALGVLAKQGLNKPVAMTVNDFSKKVREQCPELAIVFTRLSESYNCLCYKDLSLNEQNIITLTMQRQYRDFLQTLKNKH